MLRMLKTTIRTDVESAQAFGCLLFLQFGGWALYGGRSWPVGLRVEFRPGARKRVEAVRHHRRPRALNS